MTDAADCLTQWATGNWNMQPPLKITWLTTQFIWLHCTFMKLRNLKLILLVRSLPSMGPAVGPGHDTSQVHMVQNLEPVTHNSPGAFASSMHLCQVPGHVNLQAGNNAVNRVEIARFRSRHAQSVIYRAAARLWAKGLDWESAHDIANDAYQTAQVS